MSWLTYAQRTNIGFEHALSLIEPSSPYGRALVSRVHIYSKGERRELERELDNVERLVRVQKECHSELSALERSFMGLKDIRKSVLTCLEAPLTELELFEIKRFLLQLSLMQPHFDALNATAQLDGISVFAIPEALELMDIDGSRALTFHISEAHSPVLADVRKKKRAIEEKIRLAIDSPERDLLMAERSRFAALEEEEERRIRAELSVKLRPYVKLITDDMDAIGALDFAMARAKNAAAYGCVRPELTAKGLLMRDMYNPRIKKALESKGEAFTEISIELEDGACVITGANMGGKSVALKTLALNVLLVHAGIFPYAKRACVPLFDSMHIVSEDLENIDRGLSSFGAEIVRFNEVMEESSSGIPLILLDEFARGTNPDEGAAIVRAVTKFLNKHAGMSVLTTHYDGVAKYANAHYQVMGLKKIDMESVKKKIDAYSGSGASIIASYMDYGLFKVEDVEQCPRDAINICRLLSLSPEILEYIVELY